MDSRFLEQNVVVSVVPRRSSRLCYAPLSPRLLTIHTIKAPPSKKSPAMINGLVIRPFLRRERR